MTAMPERRVETAAAGKPASGEVILIPKPLRTEWMDAMALDRDLPATAFKVAGVIGFHFNKHRGDTFVKQETIARVMDLSLRTVQNAIIELERRGYLIVQRRELGVRADGRRVAGGKGVANTYLPAFQSTQLAATNSGLKVAAHCVHSWEQRTQNPAPKDAADCHPTLKNNPSRTRARVEHQLGDAGDLLRQQLGDAMFQAWFHEVRFEAVDGGRLKLSVPSAFVKNWLSNHYQEAIISCWQRMHSRGIERVEMAVRP
jgi:hypothetical protein